MQKVGILTYDGHAQLSPDDQLFLPYLEQLKIPFSIVNWNQQSPSEIDCTHLLIRSPWDYYLKIEEFLAYLVACEQKGIQIINSLPLVLWNYQKNYLHDLERLELPIVPSLIIEDRAQLTILPSLLAAKKWSKIVLKPTISGSSFKTYLCETNSSDWLDKANDILSTHSLLVQPYLASIESEGEVSLIYFQQFSKIEYSHAVLKKPKSSDFRVQVEYGGHTQAYKPEPFLMELAVNVLKQLPHPWLYARIDLVDWKNSPLISEVEVIEPSLYFNYSSEAPQKFVKALQSQLFND
jgi:glutathione synthase/RimK-type ligase-like ATP-grasp enzyme